MSKPKKPERAQTQRVESRAGNGVRHRRGVTRHAEGSRLTRTPVSDRSDLPGHRTEDPHLTTVIRD